jgi:WD40 repeat protein
VIGAPIRLALVLKHWCFEKRSQQDDLSPKRNAEAVRMIRRSFKPGAKVALGIVIAIITVCFLSHPAATEQRTPKVVGPAEAGPAKDNVEGCDLFGDPLPDDAIVRLGTVRFRHDASVASAAFSQDGTLVASADYNGGVRLWDVKTGKEIVKFAGKIRGEAVAFPAGGKTLLAVHFSGPTIQEWDLATARLVREVSSTEESLWHGPSLSISSDCRFVGMIGLTDQCGIYDMKSGKPILRLKKQQAFISCALSHDGKKLATGGWDQILRLWDVASSKELHQCPARGRWVDGMLFSPDGTTLAIATEGTLQVLDVGTGKELFHVTNVAAGCPTYSPDGKKLFAGREDTVRAWETASWKEVARVEGAPSGPIWNLIVSTDGKQAAATGSHMLQVWDLANQNSRREYEGHRGEVLCLAFSPDGKTVVSGSDDGYLCIWDRTTGRLRHRAEHKGQILCVAVSPDGKTVASGDGFPNRSRSKDHESIRLWNLSTGKLLRTIPAHYNAVYRLAFSPDGRSLASAGGDDAVVLWEPQTGIQRCRLSAGNFQYDESSIAFSKDSKTLVVGTIDDLQLWRIQEDKPKKEVLPIRESEIQLATLLPDGKTLVSVGRGRDGGITFRDLAARSDNRERTIPLPRLKCCAISPDGTLLATAQESAAIQIWSIKSREMLLELTGHRGEITSLSFSTDGAFLASGFKDTTVLLWDLPQAQLARRWLDLGSEAESAVKKGIDNLAATPQQTVPYLARRLRQAAALENQVVRLVDRLDAEDFGVREKATRDLIQLGPRVGLALRQILRGKPSAEARKRIADIMDRLGKESTVFPEEPMKPLTKDNQEKVLQGEELRPKSNAPLGIAEERSCRRAFEVLVRLGTPESREVVVSLANGDAGRWFTQMAKVSLEHLK